MVRSLTWRSEHQKIARGVLPSDRYALSAPPTQVETREDYYGDYPLDMTSTLDMRKPKFKCTHGL